MGFQHMKQSFRIVKASQAKLCNCFLVFKRRWKLILKNLIIYPMQCKEFTLFKKTSNFIQKGLFKRTFPISRKKKSLGKNIKHDTTNLNHKNSLQYSSYMHVRYVARQRYQLTFTFFVVGIQDFISILISYRYCCRIR